MSIRHDSIFRTHPAMIFLVCLALLWGVAADSYASYPIVRNFSRVSYNGGPQTWDIVQDTIGTVYFGNKYGLISYDSNSWHHYALANESEVRSLYFDEKSGRLYAGGTEEFGYFKNSDENHRMEYHSLNPLVAKLKYKYKDIWNIFPGKDEVWFQGDYELFKYDGRRVDVFKSTRKITASALVGGTIYIGTADGYLSRLSGGRLQPIDAPELAGKKIVGITRGFNGSATLVFTEFNGIYQVTGQGIVPYPTEFDTFMADNQVFSVAVHGNNVAIGTVNNGLLIKDFDDGSTTYINRDSGLQNNTVLSLSFDKMGNIWAGLDNGIDLVCYNSPMRHLLGPFNAYGSGYASHLDGNNLYLGTNQGLYSSQYPFAETSKIPVLQQLLKGQVWHIDNVGGVLMASTDGGLYSLSGTSTQKIEGCPGTWAVQQLRGNQDYAIASTYDNFYLLQRSGGGWTLLGKVAGYNDIGGNFYQDERGNIWLAHWMRGIFRLRLNLEKRKFDLVALYDTKKGLPQDKGNGVTSHGDQVIFSATDGYYVYDPISDTMKPHPTLNSLFRGLEAGALVRSPGSDIWNLGASHSISVARATASGSYELDSVTYAPISGKIFHGFENFNFISPSRIIVAGQEGFYEVNAEWKSRGEQHFPLRMSRVLAHGDTVVYSANDSLPLEVPYSLNSLRFEFVQAEYRAEKAIEYSCMLEDYDKEWNVLREKSEKEYTQLHEGTYTLHLRALNKYTRSLQESTFTFTVTPPWYRSGVAKGLYTIIALLMLGGAYRGMKIWEQHKADVATRRKDAELRIVKQRAAAVELEKEVEIAALKGEQLELQVRHKSEELSNAMLNLARKNETLLAISDSLSKLRDRLKDSGNGSKEFDSGVKKIQSLISENISHDDDWRKFTHNFDAVYEGFTKRLQELHPTLTRTEVKVCCYLRMGLSSKDMAPLFSISHRSVEMTRYRVRKKLGLAREDNLADYLASLQPKAPGAKERAE